MSDDFLSFCLYQTKMIKKKIKLIIVKPGLISMQLILGPLPDFYFIICFYQRQARYKDKNAYYNFGLEISWFWNIRVIRDFCSIIRTYNTIKIIICCSKESCKGREREPYSSEKYLWLAYSTVRQEIGPKISIKVSSKFSISY